MRALFIILILFVSCVQTIEPENLSFDELIVIEGILTDQVTSQRITISRTTPLSEDVQFDGISGASVWVESESGLRLDFTETDAGIYATPSNTAGIIGEVYQLFVTFDGRQYVSDPVTLLPTPEIDSLYAEFELSPSSVNRNGGLFNFYVDARSNEDNNRYYRWNWNSTFELTLENPSRWLWTGGNSFVTRELGGPNDSLQVEVCWQHQQSSNLIVTELLEGNTSIVRQPIHSFHSDERAMRNRYSIEVKQYAVSESAFDFWNLIAQFSQQQGFLFDTQTGTVTGNIRNVDNPEEPVLGLFEAAQERSERRFYTPNDFLDQGFLRRTRNFINCNDIEPIISVENRIDSVMNIFGETFAICCFFSTGPPNEVWFYPKSCSECTEYGDNVRPSFW